MSVHLKSRTSAIVSIVAIASAFILAALYRSQPDAAAAITVFPGWLWIAPGALVVWIASRLAKSRLELGLAGGACLALVACVLDTTGEWKSTIRQWTTMPVSCASPCRIDDRSHVKI